MMLCTGVSVQTSIHFEISNFILGIRLNKFHEGANFIWSIADEGVYEHSGYEVRPYMPDAWVNETPARVVLGLLLAPILYGSHSVLGSGTLIVSSA